jgi:hypothetical protein
MVKITTDFTAINSSVILFSGKPVKHRNKTADSNQALQSKHHGNKQHGADCREYKE